MNGINDGIQQTTKQPAVLTFLAANPWLLIGGLGVAAVIAIFGGGKRGKKAEKKALPDGSRTIEGTARPTVDSRAADGSDKYEFMSAEELQKEMIRQTMSELGKRSGAARARKKNIYQH